MAPKRRRLGEVRGLGPRPEWTHPNAARNEARVEFFDALDRVVPDVLAELHRQVWPRWRALIRWDHDRDRDDYDLLFAQPLDEIARPRHREVLRLLRHEFDSCVERWRLDVEWMRRTVHETLKLREFYGPPQVKGWAPVWPSSVPPSPRPFEAPVWFPDLIPPTEYERRFMRQARRAVREYMDEIHAWARAAGLVRSNELDAPRSAELARHAEWLVRHRVLGETFEKIAADVRTVAERERGVPTLTNTRQAVHQASRDLAHLIDLPPLD